MPSNKEILGAQRFNRKRLLTAFTSGTPDGQELEPRSLTVPLIVGAVLAVIAVIVAVVLGRFAPTLPDGWENNTLVIENGTGARYLTVDGALHPVTNVTSARLLADPEGYRTVNVDAATILGTPRGPEVGLRDVPDNVPTPADLRSGQWTACVDQESKPHLFVGLEPAELSPAPLALVASDDHYFLIADSRRHQIVASDPANVLFSLGLEESSARTVSTSWLSLFDRGSDIAPLSVDKAGTAVDGFPARLRTAALGSVIEVTDAPMNPHYLVVGDGAIEPLSDVAFQLWKVGSGADANLANPVPATVADIDNIDVVHTTVPHDWPTTITTAIDGDHLPCVSLVHDEGTTASAVGQIPLPADEQSTAPWATVTVAGGSGALVRDSTPIGAVRFVADTGLSYSLGLDPADSLTRLGYADVTITTVPGAWLQLVPDGGTLTHDAAVKGQP